MCTTCYLVIILALSRQARIFLCVRSGVAQCSPPANFVFQSAAIDASLKMQDIAKYTIFFCLFSLCVSKMLTHISADRITSPSEHSQLRRWLKRVPDKERSTARVLQEEWASVGEVQQEHVSAAIYTPVPPGQTGITVLAKDYRTDVTAETT